MEYLLRSMLFVPAYNEKFMEKAICCEADAIIFDLEDSVPAMKRREAREVLQKYLERGCFDRRQLFVRVNELGTEDLMEDLKVIKGRGILGIVTPKIKNASDIAEFSDLLEKCEEREQLQKESLKLLPLIETAEAVLNVQSIAGSNERIIALVFGGEDYLDSVWGKHEYPPKAFEVPRAMIAMAARMHGILPIDTPYLDLKNEDGFIEEESLAYAMGFAGVLIVNPRQIPWANECFKPSEEEIEHATKVIEALDTAKAEGGNIASINGKMIGPPMIKKAHKVLEMVRKIEEKEVKYSAGI